MSRVESARRSVVSLVMCSELAPDAVGYLAATRLELFRGDGARASAGQTQDAAWVGELLLLVRVDAPLDQNHPGLRLVDDVVDVFDRLVGEADQLRAVGGTQGASAPLAPCA